MTVGKRGEDSERSLPLENYRLEERGQSGSFVNKDKKRHVFIRFKNKVIVQLKISGVAADIKGVYGPYKNFMKFALPLKNNGKFYLSKIIAARYICLTVNDDDFEKADIELIDWCGRKSAGLCLLATTDCLTIS